MIRDEGYGGAMIWALDLDDYLGMCGTRWPLLTAVRTGLTGSYVPQTTKPKPGPENEVQREPESKPEPKPEPTSPSTTSESKDNRHN